jgi:hypothetical protein
MSYSTLGNYFWTSCPVLEGWAGYNFLMRLLGCEIGARVVGVGPYACIDPDMWHIGNDVCLNHIHPQAHTFEDHQLQLGHFHVKDNATVGTLAMLMQNITVGEGTVVAPLSCVMKSSELMPWGYYDGVPAVRTADVTIRDGSDGGGGFPLHQSASSASVRSFAREDLKSKISQDFERAGGKRSSNTSVRFGVRPSKDYDPALHTAESEVRIRHHCHI